MANSDAECSADNFSIRLLGHNLVCSRPMKPAPQHPPVANNFLQPAVPDPEPLNPNQNLASSSQPPLAPAVDDQPIISADHDQPAAATAAEGVVVPDQNQERGGEGRRRRRPRMTAVQRARMLEYARNVGWSIKRSDDGRMSELCAEIGITRQRCINWIKNHKYRIGPAAAAAAAAAAADEHPST